MNNPIERIALREVAAEDKFPQKKGFNIKKELFEICEMAVFSIVTVVIIFTFLFRIVGVEGASMQPGINGGDRLIISHLFYAPKAGDVVVIQHKEFLVPIIKRIIATEGQTIDVHPETGEVFVDGVLRNEPFIKELTRKIYSVTYPHTVADGCVFVMGDNRNNSRDSREVGDIDVDSIIGKVMFRIFPKTGLAPFPYPERVEFE